MKRKSVIRAAKEQNKRLAGVWGAVQDAATALHGCLVPQGEITVPVVLPWTREEVLGELKRKGKILAWAWDKAYEDGNNRRYNVRLDTARL